MTLLVTCLTFGTFGLIMSVFGPAIPTFATQFATSRDAVGSLFTTYFTGTIVGLLLIVPLSDRFGQRPGLLLGMLLFVGGIVGTLLSNQLWLGLAMMFLAGIGAGPIVGGLNLMGARLYPERSAMVLNLTNLFFGIGSVVGPALAGQLISRVGTPLPIMWFGVGLMLLMLLAVSRIMEPQRPVVSGKSAALDFGVLRVPAIWLFSALLLAYVGIEVGTGAWAASYLEQVAQFDPAQAALVTAGFWLTFTVGRLFGTLVGGRMAAEQMLFLVIGGAGLSALALVVLPGSYALYAILGLGFFFGPTYPTTIAVSTRMFPHATGLATSVMMTFGSVGGALLPWLMGVLLVQGGPQPMALLVVTGTSVMLGALLAITLWRTSDMAKPRVPGDSKM
jgi:fucose permease